MHVDPAVREAKLDAVHETLTAAVTGLVTGADWRRALEFAAQFRSRSFSNTLLIYAQHYAAFEEGRVPAPNPSYVAGFKQWISLGRHVEKGQSGYQILAPVTVRFASPTPQIEGSWRRLARGERPTAAETVKSRMIGLRPAYVWDVSQTSGDPIPERPRPHLLVGQAPDGQWDGLAAQVESRGFALRRVPDARAIGGAKGLTDYLAKEVSVRTDMDPAAQVKTLAHELGHSLTLGVPPRNVLALLLKPLVDVGHEVSQLSTDVDRTRTTTGQSPVVQGPRGDVEVLGGFFDRDQRREAAQGDRRAVHAKQVRRPDRASPHQPVRVRTRFGDQPPRGLLDRVSGP